MRQAFVHEATIRVADGGYNRALGGAVTVALCGHWEHDGPCRWPHHSAVVEPAVDAAQPVARLRVVFAAPPLEEPEVRRLIFAALEGGRLDGQDGETRWTLLSEAPA
jgi:hypothetical protein